MKDFFAKNSGKRIVINPAPYKSVINLKRVLLNEIKNNSIGLKISGDSKNVLDKTIDFTGCIDFIKNILIGAETNIEIENALNECLSYCTYNTVEQITPQLFDKEQQAREDYYEIIIACIEENLSPFIKSLASEWSALAPKLGESQILNAILAQTSK